MMSGECNKKRPEQFVFTCARRDDISVWRFSLKIKKEVVRVISSLVVLVFTANVPCYGLATLPASQNSLVKRTITTALLRTQIRYAESDDALRLLAANNADCLLLSSGTYLVKRELAENDMRLLRAIIHEDIEALMQITLDEYRKGRSAQYGGIQDLVLKHVPPGADNALPMELYVNHTVARIFEWLVLIADGMLPESDVPPREADFIRAMTPLIMAHRHTYFTREFWDLETRGRAIRAALGRGMRFYQVSHDDIPSLDDFIGKNIVPLGQDVPAEMIGNKARSFVTFNTLGLPYPRGFVITGELVAAILNGDERILDAVVPALMELFDVDEREGGFMKRSISQPEGAGKQREINELSMRIGKLDDDVRFCSRIIDEDEKKVRGYSGSHLDDGPLTPMDDSGVNHFREKRRRFLSEKDALNDRLARLEEECRVCLSVRSSPTVSVPGAYKTETDIRTVDTLRAAIKHVAASSNSVNANNVRKALHLTERPGMGIIIQRMAHGDRDDRRSGAGVVFSRDPDTAEKGICGNFAIGRAGRDIVGGKASFTEAPLQDLKAASFDSAYAKLESALIDLERSLGYPQDVEFVVQSGALYFLQTRNMVFAPSAEMRYLSEAMQEGLVTEFKAVPILEKLQGRVSRRKMYRIKDGVTRRVILKGSASTSGAMAGAVAYSIDKAEEFAREGRRVVLACFPGDPIAEHMDRLSRIPGLGIIQLSHGNPSSHETVLTRLAGIPLIIEANASPNTLYTNYRMIRIHDKRSDRVMEIREGSSLAIDGDTGEVFATDDEDVIVEDRSVIDGSFGVDIGAYRQEVVKPYLTDDGAAIRPDISYERLLEDNVAALKEYKELAAADDKTAAFRANLRKHFLHELLLWKAAEEGKDKDAVTAELGALIDGLEAGGSDQITGSSERIQKPNGVVIPADVVRSIISGDDNVLEAITQKVMDSLQVEVTFLQMNLERTAKEISGLRHSLDNFCIRDHLPNWMQYSHDGDPYNISDTDKAVIQMGEEAKRDLRRRLESKRIEYKSLEEQMARIAGTDASSEAGSSAATIHLIVRSSPVIPLPGVYRTSDDCYYGAMGGVCSREGLKRAIEFVAKGWDTEKARTLRRKMGIADDSGMSLLAQRKVDEPDGAGVVFSRNPDTAEKGICGNFVLKRDGKDIVSGNVCSREASLQILKDNLPLAYETLESAMSDLEKRSGYPQEVEFAVKDGTVYFLKTGNMVFAPSAEMRYLNSAMQEGLVSDMAAIPILEKLQDRVSRRKTYRIKDGVSRRIALRGSASTSGAMAGVVAYSIDKAEEFAREGRRVILMSYPNARVTEHMERLLEIPGLSVIQLWHGNSSSYETDLAKLAGIPLIIDAIVGQDADWSENYGSKTPHDIIIHNRRDGTRISLKEGTFLAIDGDTGEVFATDDEDVIVEDRSVIDGSFGVDIGAYRQEVVKPYLTDDGAAIRPDISYERLLEDNVAALKEYKELAAADDKTAAFRANLRKHFLHELLLRKPAQEANAQDNGDGDSSYAARDAETETATAADGAGSVTPPISRRPTGGAVSFDSTSATVLLTDLLHAQLHEGRAYEIKYDASKLSFSQIEIVKEYVRLLQTRSSDPGNITLKPFSSELGSKETLIAVYCTGRGFKGEGHVDVSVPEEDLKNYLLRITGMMNIAVAASSIPDDLSGGDVDLYRPVMSYIKNQYEAILGQELVIPDSPEDILKVIRRIVLGLPKLLRMNTDRIEEFNLLAKEALTAA